MAQRRPSESLTRCPHHAPPRLIRILRRQVSGTGDAVGLENVAVLALARSDAVARLADGLGWHEPECERDAELFPGKNPPCHIPQPCSAVSRSTAPAACAARHIPKYARVFANSRSSSRQLCDSQRLFQFQSAGIRYLAALPLRSGRVPSRSMTPSTRGRGPEAIGGPCLSVSVAGAPSWDTLQHGRNALYPLAHNGCLHLPSRSSLGHCEAPYL